MTYKNSIAKHSLQCCAILWHKLIEFHLFVNYKSWLTYCVQADILHIFTWPIKLI